MKRAISERHDTKKTEIVNGWSAEAGLKQREETGAVWSGNLQKNTGY